MAVSANCGLSNLPVLAESHPCKKSLRLTELSGFLRGKRGIYTVILEGVHVLAS